MAAEDRNGEVVSTQGECTDCSTTTTATTRERSFDELAKGLADGKLSRRKAVRMLGGALLGGALASIPGVAWAAKPASCPPGVPKCGKNCCPDVTFACAQGKCACPAGTTRIGSTCCQNAQVCGQSCGCSPGNGCCSGACTPLSTELNCGSCGNACSGGKTCQGGVCACPQGQEDCGGVCRDLLTDVANCGLCGNACALDRTCVGGECVCPSGNTLCNGQCVFCREGEAPNPNNNCQCEVICPPGHTFSSACGCFPDCPPGQVQDPYEHCMCIDAICPAQTCCCNCWYRPIGDLGCEVGCPATCRNDITTQEQCTQYCLTSTPPPGHTHQAAIFDCRTASQDQQLICIDGGTSCREFPCNGGG
jgi:hypothetical protein